MYYRDELTGFECWFTLVCGLLIGALLLPAGLGIYYLAIADDGDLTVRAIETRRAVYDAPTTVATTTAKAASQAWTWANAGDSPASPIETTYAARPTEHRPQLYALLGATSGKRRRIKARAWGLAISAGRLLLLVPLAALSLGFAAFALLSGAMSETLPDRRPDRDAEGLALLWSIFFAPHVESAGGDSDERPDDRTAALGRFDTPPEPAAPAQPQVEKPSLTRHQRHTIDAVLYRLAMLEPGWHRVEFIAAGLSPTGKACLTKLVRAGTLPAFGIEVDGREFRLAKEVR